MDHKSYQFKTNINCGGCVATVKPHLDAAEDIDRWDVDTGHKDKILTIQSDKITQDKVLNIIKKAGFKAEILEN